MMLISGPPNAVLYRKKVVVHRGGTIKKGRLINVTRCRVAGSDRKVARAANLHQATEDWMLGKEFSSIQ